MTMLSDKLAPAYYPVLTSDELTDKPVAVRLLGRAIVLVRLGGGVRAFDDYCPHRHVPLSLGSSDGTHLHCLYHGWQFAADGKLDHMPACMGDMPDVCLTSHACTEHDGWIWLRLSKDSSDHDVFSAHADFGCPTGFSSYDTREPLQGDFIHAIENFLDPTHTPYIHKGLLRSVGRQRMSISQSHSDTSFSTRYELHERQNGLINRLFDTGINVNIARFSLPALAVIDYLKDETLAYRIALFFVPSAKGQMMLSVRVCVPTTIVPARVKFMLLRPFLKTLLRQDQYALTLHHTHKRHPQTPYVITGSDLVIDHLLHLLTDAPAGVDKSGVMTLH